MYKSLGSAVFLSVGVAVGVDVGVTMGVGVGVTVGVAVAVAMAVALGVGVGVCGCLWVCVGGANTHTHCVPQLFVSGQLYYCPLLLPCTPPIGPISTFLLFLFLDISRRDVGERGGGREGNKKKRDMERRRETQLGPIMTTTATAGLKFSVKAFLRRSFLPSLLSLPPLSSLLSENLHFLSVPLSSLERSAPWARRLIEGKKTL